VSGRLDGKVAVITGGGSGIGRATTLTFLRESARVVIGDLNEAGLAETVALARAQGHADRLAPLRGDVSVERDVAGLVELAVDRFQGLDCIFNNAGVGGAFGPIGESTAEEWDFTFAVLVRGVFLGIKHASNRMKAQGRGGSIINTASIAGIGGGGGPHAYSAAKAAVVNLTKTLAWNLGPEIRVNAVAPGWMEGDWMKRMLKDKYEDLMGKRAKATPLKRVVTAEDVAETMMSLIQGNRFVTGEIIVIDGGFTSST